VIVKVIIDNNSGIKKLWQEANLFLEIYGIRLGYKTMNPAESTGLITRDVYV
jgi:hypothetical protein